MAKVRVLGVLLGMLFFGITTPLSAQNFYVETPRTFYGGLSVGTNFSQVDGDRYAGYHKVGLNVSGIVYTRLAEHLALSLEIGYVQKGSRSHKYQFSTNKIYTIYKYGIDLSYAEVPLMINYFDRRRSHFGAGFSYGQLVRAKEYVEADKDVDLSNYPFRKSDFSFIAAGNLHLWKGLFLNMRFQYSLFSIRKNYHPEFGRANQFNNIWTLRLMYLF